MFWGALGFIFFVVEAKESEISDQLLDFVNSSPSPWHSTQSATSYLLKYKFQKLRLDMVWDLKKEGRYYITQGKSTLIAFVIGGNYINGNGFSLIAAHSDSPTLRLKPASKRDLFGYIQLKVQPYGGGNWYTWFDRDLALAGLVIYKESDTLKSKLYKINRPILIIPSIAVHVHPDLKTKFALNKEDHLNPIMGLSDNITVEKVDNLFFTKSHDKKLLSMLSKDMAIKSISDILDFELCLYDTNKAVKGGINEEFIFASRLDNLFGVFTGLQALIQSLDTVQHKKRLQDDSNIRVFAMFDHEEIGSKSNQGASSALMKSILRRLATTIEFSEHSERWVENNNQSDPATMPENSYTFERAIDRSFLISADQTHAIHPNYPNKHDVNHEIKLNKGPVIKYNSNLKYVTTAITAAIIRFIAQNNNISYQVFASRNDISSGSTIGPILSALLGIRTVDVGGPQLAMHSIRETCAVASIQQTIDLYKAFYEDFPHLNLSTFDKR